MSKLLVMSYRAYWNTRERAGSIRLTGYAPESSRPTSLTSREIDVPDVADMHFLVDLLRNERPIVHDSKRDLLYTSEDEGVGEGER